MMAHQEKPDEHKLEEMILFFSNMCERDESFGSVRLNKLLFNADFRAYQMFGKSLSGLEYFALPEGPAPRIMKQVMTRMVRQKSLAIRVQDYYGNIQKKPVALRQPNLTGFSVLQMNLMYELLNHYWGRTGRSVSDESHGFAGWSASNEKERIPYEVALVGKRDPTLDEIGRGLELEAMAQECLAHNATRKAQRDSRRA
jgi:hypothetical protein